MCAPGLGELLVGRILRLVAAGRTALACPAAEPAPPAARPRAAAGRAAVPVADRLDQLLHVALELLLEAVVLRQRDRIEDLLQGFVFRRLVVGDRLLIGL